MTESNSDNRREFVRLPKGYSVEINEFKFPITSQERISATCADISTGGVCVESPEPFKPETRLQVRVNIPRLNKFMSGFFKAYENDAEQYLQAIAEVCKVPNRSKLSRDRLRESILGTVYDYAQTWKAIENAGKREKI